VRTSGVDGLLHYFDYTGTCAVEAAGRVSTPTIQTARPAQAPDAHAH
jgi:hypothetical protein